MRRIALACLYLAGAVSRAAAFACTPTGHVGVQHTRLQTTILPRQLQQQPAPGRKALLPPLRAVNSKDSAGLVADASKELAQQRLKQEAQSKPGGGRGGKQPLAKVVLVAGFESFNLQLYNQVRELPNRKHVSVVLEVRVL
jgi:hypothetical protein